MYVERAGEKLPPKSLGGVLRERHQERCRSVAESWERCRRMGVPFGAGPNAEVPKTDWEDPAYSYPDEYDDVVITFRQPFVADLDEVDLEIEQISGEIVSDDADKSGLNKRLRKALKAYAALVCHQIVGLETSEGPVTLAPTDEPDDLGVLEDAQLLQPIHLAHTHLRGLSSAEKKRCGSQEASTLTATTATTATSIPVASEAATHTPPPGPFQQDGTS